MELPLSSSRVEGGLAVVILGGGQGRRMGGIAKPLLVDRSGRTLLEQLIERFQEAADEMAVVVPEALRSAVEARTSTRIVVDQRAGPAAALVVVAAELESRWLFVIGGDQAHMRTEALDRLLERLDPARARRAPSAIVPKVGDRRQPLGALYRRSALLELGPMHDQAMHGLFDRFASVEELADAELGTELLGSYASVNSWAEAEALGLLWPS